MSSLSSGAFNSNNNNNDSSVKLDQCEYPQKCTRHFSRNFIFKIVRLDQLNHNAHS